MIYRLFLFYIVVFTFLGCAYIPKTNLDAVTNIRTEYSKCNKIPGRIASGYKNFDLEDLQRDEITGTQKTGINYDSINEGFLREAKIILREIENSNAVELNQGIKSKYIFVFATHTGPDNLLLNWVSVLSLGIIPIKLNGLTSMSVEVYDSNGKLIYESESVKFERDTYRGWFWILFSPKKEQISEEQFDVKAMPSMINDLINGMVKNNILDCKK